MTSGHARRVTLARALWPDQIFNPTDDAPRIAGCELIRLASAILREKLDVIMAKRAIGLPRQMQIPRPRMPQRLKAAQLSRADAALN